MKKILFVFVRKNSFAFYKKTLALVLAFVMIFNLTSEVLAQALPSKNYFQASPEYQSGREQLAKELEAKRFEQLLTSLGINYDQYLKDLAKYAKKEKKDLNLIDIPASYEAYTAGIREYYNDYIALVKVFSKKTYLEVLRDGQYYVSKSAEKIKYDGKEYNRVALLHAAIHNLAVRKTTGYKKDGITVFSAAKEAEYTLKEKLTVIEFIYQAILNDLYYPQDEQAIWNLAYEIVEKGEGSFDNDKYKADIFPGISNAADRQKRDQGKDARKKEASQVSKAMELLPLLSRTSDQKTKSAEIVYKLGKSIMRDDYAIMGITSASEALLVLNTEDSINKLYNLIGKDLYRGLGTELLLFALDSLSLEEWAKRNASLANRLKKGLGQYHNPIGRRYMYVDPDKNDPQTRKLAESVDTTLEAYYNVVYTDIFEGIGRDIGKRINNARIAGLADRLVKDYLSAVNKMKMNGGQSMAVGELQIHTSIIVGILSGAKKKTENLTKAAKIIYNGNWWDINEATQRDKNNIAAKYLGLEKKGFNPDKKKEFTLISRGKNIGKFCDVFVNAGFLGSLVLSIPAVLVKIGSVGSKILNNLRVVFKAGSKAKAPAVAKPVVAKPAEPKAPKVEKPEVKAPKTEQAEIKPAETEKIGQEYTATVGEGGGGGGAMEVGETPTAISEVQRASDLASKVQAQKAAEAIEAENAARAGKITKYNKNWLVNKPWAQLEPWRKTLATLWVNIAFNNNIFLSTFRIFKPRYITMSSSLPLATTAEVMVRPISTVAQTTRAAEAGITTADVFRASENVSRTANMAASVNTAQATSKAGQYLKMFQDFSAGRGILAGSFGITGILNEFHGGPSAGRELSSLERNNIIRAQQAEQQAKADRKQEKANKKKEKSSKKNNNQAGEEVQYVYEIPSSSNTDIENQRVAAMTPVPVSVGSGEYIPALENGQHMEVLQGLFDKVFGKRYTNRLYVSLLPPVLMQLLSNGLTLEQWFNRIPAIEEAFARAEKRAAEVVGWKPSSEEVKDPFLQYLEEELASAGITEEKVNKLLQDSEKYFEEQQTAKENNNPQVKNYANIYEYMLEKDPRGLLKELSQKIKQNPNDDVAYFYRAKAKAALKIYVSAVKDMDRAIAINGTNHIYYYERAWLKRFLKNYQGAKEDLDKAIELHKSAKYFYERAVIKESFLQDYQGAVEDYQEALKLEPNRELYQLSLMNAQDALAEEQAEQEQAAQQQAVQNADKKAENKPARRGRKPYKTPKEKAREYANTASYLELTHRWKKALTLYNMAVELDPDNPSYRFSRGMFLFYTHSKKDEGYSDVLKAVESNPTNPYYNAGLSYIEWSLGKKEDAIKHMQLAIRYETDESVEKEYNEELRSMQESLRNEELAAQRKKQPRPQQTKMNPQESKAKAEEYFQKAQEASKQGNNDLALRYFDLAIEHDLTNAAYFYARAVFKRTLGKNEEAHQDYLKALELDPNNTDYLGEITLFEWNVLKDQQKADLHLAQFNEIIQAEKANTAKVAEEQTEQEQAAQQQAVQNADKKAENKPARKGRQSSKTPAEQALNFAKQAAYVYKRVMTNKSLELYTKAIELDGNNPVFYIERADVYISLSQEEDAYKDMLKAVELDSTNPDYYAKLARFEWIYLDKEEEAIKHMRLAVKYEQDEAKQEEYLETILKIQHNIEHRKARNAEKARQKAKEERRRKTNPQEAKAEAEEYLQKAQEASKQGNNDLALRYFDLAIEHYPYGAAYFYARAEFKRSLGKNEEAHQDYLKALELDPNNTDYLEKIGNFEWHVLGLQDEALAHLKQATTNETSASQKKTNFVDGVREQIFGKENSNKLYAFILPLPKVLRQLLVGEITLEQLFNRTPAIKKAFENAEKRAEQVLADQNSAEAKNLFLGYLEEELAAAKVDPKKAEKLLQVSRDYLNEKQDEPTTRDDAQNANKPAASNYKAPKVAVKVYDNKSIDELITEDPKGLLKELSQAIKENPNDDMAYFYRAKAKAELKIYVSAIKDLDRAISINPKNHEYFYLRAWLKRLTGDYLGAKEDFDKAIELFKIHKYLYERAVIKHYYLQDYQGAIEDYKEALILKPNTETYQLSLEGAQEALEEQEDQAPAQIQEQQGSSTAPQSTAQTPNLLNKFGGIYMPIILSHVVMAHSKIVNPDAPKYTQKWSSFKNLSPKDIAKKLNQIPNKHLLVKDRYGKLPIEYALKNKKTTGWHVKSNDAFIYVYLYSSQAGLTPNTIIDEEKGLTLAMVVLRDENRIPQEDFNKSKSFSSFSFITSDVDVRKVDKEGNSLLKYLIEGANPIENAETLFSRLTPEQRKKLVNRKNKQGQGVIEFLDNASISSDDKIKLIRIFNEMGLEIDTSDTVWLNQIKTTDLKNYLYEMVQQVKKEEAYAAYRKQVETAFYNPNPGQAVMAKDGKKVSLEILTYIDEKLAEEYIDKVEDINEINEDGFTALMYAAKNPNPKVTERVLKKGGSANIKNKDGMRALLIAREANNTAVVEILEKKDKIFKQQQKAEREARANILNLNPDKTEFVAQKNLLPKKSDLKGLYVSLENSGDLIAPLENVKDLRYVLTDNDVKLKEEKHLSSVYDAVKKDPFKDDTHKVMAVLQGGGKLFILNHGLVIKDANTGNLAADIIPDPRRYYGIVRIIHNHIPGVAPITKADFMLLPSIVRSKPFYEDGKFIVYHTPQPDGNILVTTFAKVSEDQLIIVSMRKISKEDAANNAKSKEVVAKVIASVRNSKDNNNAVKENIKTEEINSVNKGNSSSQIDINTIPDVVRPEGEDENFFFPKRNRDRVVFNENLFFENRPFTFEGGKSVKNPKNYTILVVQSDKAILEQAKLSLEKEGYNVLTADNGTEALNILNKYKESGKTLHFVLVDTAVSPSKSGYEIAQYVFKEDLDSVVISFSKESADPQTRWNKGFDFSFNPNVSDVKRVGSYVNSLIRGQSFEGGNNTIHKESQQEYTIDAYGTKSETTIKQNTTQGEVKEVYDDIEYVQKRNVSRFASFLPNSPDYVDKSTAIKDIENWKSTIDRYARSVVKREATPNPITNRDRYYYNENEFYARKRFEGIYNVENPQDYTILVLQDDVNYINREIDSLKKKGFNVIYTTNGEVALSKLKHSKEEGKRIHFVLIDSWVEKLNGYDLAREIFSQEIDVITIATFHLSSPIKYYNKGFDYALNPVDNDKLVNAGDFVAYLINKYDFKGGQAAQATTKVEKILTFDGTTQVNKVKLDNPQDYGIAVMNDIPASEDVLKSLREQGFNAVQAIRGEDINNLKFTFEQKNRKLNIILVGKHNKEYLSESDEKFLDKHNIVLVKVDYETADLTKIPDYVSNLIQEKGLEGVPFVNNTDWVSFDWADRVEIINSSFKGEYNIDNPQDYNVLVAFKEEQTTNDVAGVLKDKGFNIITATSVKEVSDILDEYKKNGQTIHFAFLGDLHTFFNGTNSDIMKQIEDNKLNTIVFGVRIDKISFVPGDIALRVSAKDKFGNFLSYLIQKYGFKGTPKKKPSSDNTIGAVQTYYIEQNQNIIAPEDLSKPVEQAKLTTEIKEEQNPLFIFPNSAEFNNTSSASMILLLSVILFSKIGLPGTKNAQNKNKKNYTYVSYTEDIKSKNETPLNIRVKVDPNLRAFRKYDRIVFDKKGRAYYRGDRGTKIMSNFYMTIPHKRLDLKFLINAVKNSKLSTPFEIKLTFSHYEKEDLQRVLLYDHEGKVMNINILLPEDVLQEGEGIMFAKGGLYTFDKETLKRKERLNGFDIRVPKRQIPNLTEVFSNSKIPHLTLYMVPNTDKAKVVYRDSMLTNANPAKAFPGIAKTELGLTDTQATGLMLGIQYFVPMLSLVVRPLISRVLGEKSALLLALKLSAAAGLIASLFGFNGFVHDVVRTPFQRGIFVTACFFISLSTLFRQMVSPILIKDNSGVIRENANEEKTNLNTDNSASGAYNKQTIKKIFKRNRNNQKNTYSIPIELILSKAFVWKSIGTLIFLTFPFIVNQSVYLLSGRTIELNLDYGLSFPLLALASAVVLVKTYKTNLRNRSKKEIKKEKGPKKSFSERIQNTVKKLKDSLQPEKIQKVVNNVKTSIKTKKEEVEKFKSKDYRQDWTKENGKIVRYFTTLVFANAHEFVVSTALALQLSEIFKDSATSNFYIALGLYAPLLLGRLIFNKVREKTTRPTSFVVFMGLSALGTLLMFLNPTSQVMLIVGAGIACLGTGNCFTLLYTDVTKDYENDKEKELTISSLGSVAVVLSALLTLVAPELIENGHFQGALFYGLALITAVAVLSYPSMKDSPIIKFFKAKDSYMGVKFNDEEKEGNPTEKKAEKKKPFEDMGKWWYAPKNGPDMNNPEPQN